MTNTNNEKSVNFNNVRLLNALIPDKRPIQDFARFSTSVSMTVSQYNLCNELPTHTLQ